MPSAQARTEFVGLRLTTVGLAYIDQRAAAEVDGPGNRKRSEMIRRMLAYASAKMPTGWKP